MLKDYNLCSVIGLHKSNPDKSSTENIGLSKFDALYRLVVGILENVKNRKELIQAMEKLEWKIDVEE